MRWGEYENCIQELKNLKIQIKDYSDLKDQVEWDHSKTDNVQELQRCHQILTALNKTFPAIERMKLGVKFLTALIEMRHLKNYNQAEKMLWDIYEKCQQNKQHLCNSYGFNLYVPGATLSWAIRNKP